MLSIPSRGLARSIQLVSHTRSNSLALLTRSVKLSDSPGQCQASASLAGLLNHLLTLTRNREPERDIGGTLAKPTLAEYTAEGAKGFLDVLESVADLIPVPGVAIAVKAANNIIRACDDTHAALKRAEELKLRIEKLVMILVNELKGKKKEEIEAKLHEDIEALSIDLEYIQRKLNEIGSQNAILLIFFRGFNEDKVKDCVNRLDNSLANFDLKRKINDANLHHILQEQILAFHASNQEMKGTVDYIRESVDDLKIFMRERLPVPPSSQPRIRSSIPANSSIFHGRDSLVAKLVRILTSKSDGGKLPRVCLLGPGGMGKTSTALAVMADPEMKKLFPGQHQIWVPCVKATSLSLFLDTLYSSLGTTQKSGDTLKDIVSEINSSSEPLVILLDNFETPWNVMESRSETEQILYEIDRIAHVTLFVTMRASIAPFNGDQWQSFQIEEVDEEAARQIYLDICPAGKDDPKLSVLLQTLGHMPLAITLMANLARSFDWDAGKLLEKYGRIGTDMIGQGEDANHSLNMCISLSVDSPPMKKHPEAYRLLAILAMLPVGTTDDALEEWWARDSPNLVGALQVLTEASLVQRRGTHYFVLPVIRSYVLDRSRFPADVRAAMITSACNFLTHHNSSPGDASFKEHSNALSEEEGNLQAILLQASDVEPKLIEAFLLLGQHQLSTRPRLKAIEHALELAGQMKSDPKLVGDVLTCHGRILLNLDHYDQAIEQFSNARQNFLSIPNEQLAARCLLDLAEVYIFTNDAQSCEEAITSAQSVFEKLDDGQGVALSFYYRGMVFGQTDRYTEGIESLTRASEMFEKLQDAPNRAKCLYFLELVYLWDGQYDEGVRLGMAAVQEHDNLGQYAGDPMLVLGRLLFQKGNYPAALEILVRTLAICKSYGSPISIAQTLETIGRTHAKMDKKEDAHAAYEEAMQYNSANHTSAGEPGMIRCRFLIRQAENPLLEPTPEERFILQSMYQDF